MALERDLRVCALRDVLLGGDAEYQLRVKLRWYARTFHTPLHMVYQKIPIHDVLRAYWEEHYEALRNADDEQAQSQLAQERELLCMTPEEAAAATQRVDAQVDDAEATLARLAANPEVLPVGARDEAQLPDDGLPEDVVIDFAPTRLLDDPQSLVDGAEDPFQVTPENE